MYLTLFIIFLCLSLVLITLGLFKAEHSELSLAGFMFMFILAMIIVLGGTIQYKTGVNETYEYVCLCCSNGEVTPSPGICNENTTNMVINKIIAVDNYENWSEGTFGHFLGYWLAIISAVGFIGTIASLRGNIKQ